MFAYDEKAKSGSIAVNDKSCNLFATKVTVADADEMNWLNALLNLKNNLR